MRRDKTQAERRAEWQRMFDAVEEMEAEGYAKTPEEKAAFAKVKATVEGFKPLFDREPVL